MPKKLIKRYLPTPEKIKNLKGLGWLGSWLHNPNIWHLHRHSVAKAFLIGLFFMAIPIPSQMIFAALFAVAFRANLPLSVALVWISNPLTMAPIFYFNYEIGALILGHAVDPNLHFELSWHWLTNVLGELWKPLYLGSVVVGLVLGVVAYFAIHIIWRLHVIKRWQERCVRKRLQKIAKQQQKKP
ncbi:hypothetical protein THMIRHAS_14830 [Thiosulfatimonas sediminis]|uniref:DUF2062 domain-containing protein n=1 Tax=Thiosulfatimonas sediminis TaxID=2675054 RepID=A0A6F8PVW2_9GAMM|nr:DUF2062 domain-containing protein [Thiosulfatimonas sediminis]BBP46110.1 hypothetical protein THMIRHAS_14830 [Thiosulfatimonas sediminis]